MTNADFREQANTWTFNILIPNIRYAGSVPFALNLSTLQQTKARRTEIPLLGFAAQGKYAVLHYQLFDGQGLAHQTGHVQTKRRQYESLDSCTFRILVNKIHPHL